MEWRFAQILWGGFNRRDATSAEVLQCLSFLFHFISEERRSARNAVPQGGTAASTEACWKWFTLCRLKAAFRGAKRRRRPPRPSRLCGLSNASPLVAASPRCAISQSSGRQGFGYGC